MKILPFLFGLLLVAFHGAAGRSLAGPVRPYMECGYRGTFCHSGKCPRGNAYLGLCRFGYNCCRW
ncbi:gallinacin-4-like [Manacus candei]|uniref:gallinacin-4-like n=1 Tax=Manacus candei TaxID=415023 RepID=UPI0004EFC4D2|nr:gallinacin-4-like [Manacus candei]